MLLRIASSSSTTRMVTMLRDQVPAVDQKGVSGFCRCRIVIAAAARCSASAAVVESEARIAVLPQQRHHLRQGRL